MPPDSFGEKVQPPSGTILLWGDPLADIPAGWVICDGNNGTPNMLDRFARCVPGAGTDPGTTGGTDSVTLSTSQIPSHNHGVTLESAGSHNHTWTLYTGSDDTTDNRAHSGGDSATSSSDGSHSHTGSTDSAGSGNSIENRPQYYEAAYIMKT